MHAKAHHVQRALDSLGVDTEVRELPARTRMSHEAASAVGTTVPQIAKGVVFTGAEGVVLVLASGANRVSINKVKKHTGFSIGGVPPVGHTQPPTTLADSDLLGCSVVWSAAGTPHTVFPIAPGDLVRITRATVADVKV